jgi:hypothetical protein
MAKEGVKKSPVMLSGAKHLHFISLKNKQMQILRCAQDDTFRISSHLPRARAVE